MVKTDPILPIFDAIGTRFSQECTPGKRLHGERLAWPATKVGPMVTSSLLGSGVQGV